MNACGAPSFPGPRRRRLLLHGLARLRPLQRGCRRRATIVLGFDGMDWELTQKYRRGRQDAQLARLAREGHAQPLGTSVPPLSPIAWSDFITGMDLAGTAFDFLHRDPDQDDPGVRPGQGGDAEPLLKLGRWQVPASGSVELLRRGKEFWSALEDRGVHSWVYRMPVNFPPSGTASRELSGMGTPDLTGSLGEFSFYTSALFYDQVDSGGKVYPLDLWEDRAEGKIYGPDNPFLVEPTPVETSLTVHFDPEEDVAEVEVGDGEARAVLAAGEWSDWVPVTFEMIPTQSIQASVRFYLRSVRPEVELYMTPLQIDPLAPALPISTPEDYATELAEETGRFYTQGMPEDTKAITEGVFDRDEFLAQAAITQQEIADQLKVVLSQFHDGLLFYYFGDTDQVSHVLWGSMDPTHPSYDPEVDPQYAHVIPDLYHEVDGIVGYVLDHMPEGARLVIMSDHGFSSWRRSFNLNSWLRDEGYLAVKNPDLAKDPGFFLNVDWARTRAYGVGFNGLYVNQRGRESHGIVDPSESKALLAEIGEKLLATIDPETGEPAVTRVYPSAEFFHDRGALDVGPDMVVGYAKGTRGSNEGALGELTDEVIFDNMGRWTADHAMDHTTVPGILFTNRPLAQPVAGLRDLAPALLAEFDIESFPQRHEAP
ncbi:MAG: alkaline phosphatase family protein [Thermoanaerobaculia bacterium]